MQKHRTHYRLIWKHLRKYLLETTKLPEPDTCSKYNQHGGVMPAMRDEFGLTDRQAGEILDKMGTGKAISYESLKGVSGMLGYPTEDRKREGELAGCQNRHVLLPPKGLQREEVDGSGENPDSAANENGAD